jgi:hypothetical protein
MRSSLFPHKKTLHFQVESPLTHHEYIAMYMALERAKRPSGFRAKHADPPKSGAWLSLFAYLEIIVFPLELPAN